MVPQEFQTFQMSVHANDAAASHAMDGLLEANGTVVADRSLNTPVTGQPRHNRIAMGPHQQNAFVKGEGV